MVRAGQPPPPATSFAPRLARPRPGAEGGEDQAAFWKSWAFEPRVSRSGKLAQPSARQARAAVPFEEVWSRSYCASRETLVDILSEFPHHAEHTFKPPCVPLWRCTGCCGDDGLECAPVETRPVYLQVVQMSPLLGTTEQVELTFTEHTVCACRQRGMRSKDERSHRTGAKRKLRKPSPVPPGPLYKLPQAARPGDQSQSQKQTTDPTAQGKGTSN